MEKIKQQLIKSGYKLTKARLVVLEYLYLNHLTVSARKLHQEVKVCDQASVYRTLNLFEKLNLVNVEIVNKEKIYFHGNNKQISETMGKLDYYLSRLTPPNGRNWSNWRSKIEKDRRKSEQPI